jgi:hypothetical protein
MARLLHEKKLITDMGIVRSKTLVCRSGCCHSLLHCVLVLGVSLVVSSRGLPDHSFRIETASRGRSGTGRSNQPNDLGPGLDITWGSLGGGSSRDSEVGIS